MIHVSIFLANEQKVLVERNLHLLKRFIYEGMTWLEPFSLHKEIVVDVS